MVITHLLNGVILQAIFQEPPLEPRYFPVWKLLMANLDDWDDGEFGEELSFLEFLYGFYWGHGKQSLTNFY